MNCADKPLVSIGMPVYNNVRFIRQTVDSLLQQTYENIEVVISDNASTDGTEDICRAYAAADPRVRYYRNDVNLGRPPNYRRVFDLSRGKYFTWNAIDDFRPPNALAACVDALERSERAVLAHGPILVKIEGREKLIELANRVDLSDASAIRRIQSYTKHIEHRAILYALYRREPLTRLRFEGGYAHDYLFTLQVCLLGPFEYVSTPIIIYRERADISGDPAMRYFSLRWVDLLNAEPRRMKCLTALFMGFVRLMRVPGCGRGERVAAAVAHGSSYVSRHLSRLLKETIFLLFRPLAHFLFFIWKQAFRWPLVFRLTRHMRSMLAKQ